MIKSYAIPGDSQETRTEFNLGNPYILMQSDRPEPHYVATESGEWVEPSAQKVTKCTPAQGLVALFALKQITEDDLLAAIAQIQDPVQQYTARIGLQRATTWERESQTMQSMAALLGLTEQDLDDLFEYAQGVTV